MFKIEKNNSKIGKYLDDLIGQKYESRRAFCREYIQATGEEPTNETINNMSNRLAQIVKGNDLVKKHQVNVLEVFGIIGLDTERFLGIREEIV